jgi:hypothetical protein
MKFLIAFYSLYILLFVYSAPKSTIVGKSRKIVVCTFTGKENQDKIWNWFYIKNTAGEGFNGYFYESAAKVNDFKKAHFIFSKTRPPEFEEQFISEERIQFISPNDLPSAILKDSASLESYFE